MTDVRDKIQLKKPDGTIIAELPMYRSLYEVPLNRYIDFIKAEEPLSRYSGLVSREGQLNRFVDFVKDAMSDNTTPEDLQRMYESFLETDIPIRDKEEDELKEINVARVMAKCVGEFFGVPLNSVLGAHYGNTDDIPSGGLQSLYVWIANLVGTFQARIRTPQDCYFDYKGGRYTVPIIGVQTLSALPLLPAMDTGQMIEAYEIRRIAKRMVETTQDPDGSGLYTYYLNLLSVLALKDGERLPYGESEVENFINARTEYFADIHGGNGVDTGTALDIDFFLASLMRPSEVTGAAIGTLTNHALDLVQRIARRGKPNRKRSTPQSPTASKSLSKSDTGKSTSNSLRGVGMSKRVKVPSKQ